MNTAIILAAGKGTRMNAAMNKQFMNLNDKPLLAQTLETFNNCKSIDSIILAVGEGELRQCKEQILDAYDFDKVDKLVCGGRERQQSVFNCIRELGEDCGIVVIHDGARPLVTSDIIEKCIAEAVVYGAASVGVPAKETIKLLDGEGFVQLTPERGKVWITQTPQAFSVDIIKRAHRRAIEEGILGTDDAFLAERIGIKVRMVEGSYENIKVTTPEDMIIAETIMSKGAIMAGGVKMPEFRVGNGYDVHKLTEGRKLILGGVEIPYNKGLLGHSDADALVHSIMDALLGACGEPDIGHQFPDGDIEYKDISSLILLKKVRGILTGKGYGIANIDSVISAQNPKLQPYIENMKTNIAEVLQLDGDRIGIKATTTEGLGFVGRGRGIAAYSTACIYK